MLLLVIAPGLCLRSHCQQFKNPVRVPTSVDPDTIISGDFNGDGRPDLVWFNVTPTNSIGHVVLAQPNGTYLGGQTFTIPGALTGIPSCATADVTRDGKIDLICAVLNYGSYNATVLVYPGNGDGTLGAPVATQYGNQYGEAVTLTLVGDLNADGIPDFILLDFDYTPANVLLSNGSGGFLPTQTVQNSYNNSVPVATDINGDGIPDILWPSGATVALGKGNGTFGNLISPYPTGHGPVVCAFHDMDGDGKLDAVCGYVNTGNVYGTSFDILHGNGDGTFNPTPIAHQMFGSPTISQTGEADFLQPDVIRDINGDGIPDILASSGDGLTVLLGRPGLTFAPPVPYVIAYSGYGFSGRVPEQEQYVDLNGDGVLDIMAAGPNGIYLIFGHPDGTFSSAISTRVSIANGHIAVADFNGDGKPDVVSSGAPGTSVSLGNGDGTFAAPLTVAGAPYWREATVYVGDFNGDGKPDLLSSDQQANYYLMFGNGDGTFAASIPTPTVTAPPPSVSLTGTFDTPYAIAADLNGDGKSDLFYIDTTALSPTYSLVTSLSRGNGVFDKVASTYPAVAYNTAFYNTPSAPVLADFQHRGVLDAAYYANQSVYVVRGNGDGSFNLTPTILAAPTVAGALANYQQALQVGDFDNDGHLDIAFLSWYPPGGNYFYQEGPSCVFIYYGNGDGTFQNPVQAGCFTHTYSDMRVADINGDGHPDIVLQAASSLNTFVVGAILNQGSRTFGPEVNFTAGSLSGDFFVADLNLDGRPDLVFGNQQSANGYSANTVTALLNETSATATGTLTSAPNPSSIGQAFNITATLTPPTAGTLYAGSISFYVDGNLIGTATLSGNSATIAGPTNLPAGPHQLSATWPGDANDPPLTLNATQTVNKLPTTSQVSLSSPVTGGVPFQITATVSPVSPFVSSPTGTVTFLVDGNAVGTGTLNPLTGVATFSDPGISGGSHTVSCTYSGDGNFSSSTCPVIQSTFAAAPSALTLSSSPNPAYADTPIAITANLTSSGKAAAGDSILISIYAGTTLVSQTTTTTDANGNATYTSPGLSPGTYTLTASFAGNAALQISNATPVTQVVLMATSTATLTASPSPAYQGQTVTLVAVVANSSTTSPTPAGGVTFFDGTTAIATATLNASGSSTATIATLAVGTHVLSAGFAATPTFIGSKSNNVSEVILPSGFTIALSPASLTLASDKAGSTTIQLTSLGNFAGPLALTYGSLPQYGTASISPPTVTLAAAGTATSTLNLNTLSVAANVVPTRPGSHMSTVMYVASLLLLPVVFSRRKKLFKLATLLVMAVALQMFTACSNSFYFAHAVAPGTYTVPVTATDTNGNSQTANLTLIVTP